MDWLNDNTLRLSQATLDASWAKQRLTLENIANNDTPGYKAKYAVFEDLLRQRLSSFQGRPDVKSSDIRGAIDSAKLQVYESTEESMRLDGNNVNLDVEELELSRNVYQYQFALRQITDDLSRLRVAIEGK